MTAYRWIPLLADLIREDITDERRSIAWKQLVVKMRAEIGTSSAGTDIEFEVMLREFVNSSKSWIIYSLVDMARYVDMYFFPYNKDAKYERIRYDHYAYRMEEQQRFLDWNTQAFTFPDTIEETEPRYVLDIGCGSFPFYALMNDENMIQYYLGIDKRSMQRFIDEDPRKFHTPDKIGFLQFDILIQDWAILKTAIPKLTTIFMGEVLHCLPTPLIWLRRMTEEFPKLREICILELSTDKARGLSQGFEYHMQAHGSGDCFQMCDMPKVAEDLDMELKIREASSQHTMYILTRKPTKNEG